MFQGSGERFTMLGFKYWSDINNPDNSFITWQVDGVASHCLGAPAMAPDQGPTGSSIGQ